MKERPYKGQSLYCFPDDYTVIDIETTGLSPGECEILEISALRCRENRAVAHFSTLIKPRRRIPYYITQLTGITNAMVESAPDIAQALRGFLAFVGEDLLMGYNVNFDVNFLYDNVMRVYGLPLRNNFVDVLRFSRKVLPELPSRAQTAVAAHFGIETGGAHRALRDCEICREVYMHLREMAETEK